MKALLAFAFVLFAHLHAHSHCHSSQRDEETRRKRTGRLSLETGRTAVGELLVSLPLTILLPSLVLKKSLFAARNRRTTLDADADGTLEAILHTLGAESLDCQQRLLCDVMESPKKYRPLSDIVYLMLRNDVPSRHDLSRGRLDFRFYEDYRRGFVAGRHAFNTNDSGTDTCERSFGRCRDPAPHLDPAMLKYWQRLSDSVPLTITV